MKIGFAIQNYGHRLVICGQIGAWRHAVAFNHKRDSLPAPRMNVRRRAKATAMIKARFAANKKYGCRTKSIGAR